jgi:hypothetical protein
MIRKNIFLLLLIIAVLISCGKVDNYDYPNGDIYGVLTDSITNEPLQSEQPNGFNVKLFEKGGILSTPIVIAGKTDGNYENALIFQKEYKVLPTEGPFFEYTGKDTLKVQVGSRTEVNFKVMPYLAITNVTVTPAAGQVTVTYNITRQRAAAGSTGKINQRITLVSIMPEVSNIVYTSRALTSLTGIADATILTTQFTDVVTGLTSGKTYWVRVAARTSNSLSRFNYSKTFQVTIP